MANPATTLPLELEPAAPRRTRVRRAMTGERTATKRVTSFQLDTSDERLLDLLRQSYGTQVIGQAIREALRDAARSRGIDVEAVDAEAAV
ncbi:MAG: hypothetical protein M0P31_17785 [Solirubrobacteraceae bacterium]|nr:hypothetical protein [Solirubrobacteraceae bacterium]